MRKTILIPSLVGVLLFPVLVSMLVTACGGATAESGPATATVSGTGSASATSGAASATGGSPSTSLSGSATGVPTPSH